MNTPSNPDALVLLVDDDADSVYAMAEYLDLCGIRSVVATSAEEGFVLANRERPRAAVIDLGMPGTDGEMLARTFQDHPTLGRIPLVMVTGRRIEEVLGRAEGLYAEVLQKPVDPAHLIGILERCLTRDHPSRFEVAPTLRPPPPTGA